VSRDFEPCKNVSCEELTISPSCCISWLGVDYLLD